MNSPVEAASRIIGLRHRTKQTAAGEARPTQVAIRYQGEAKAKIMTFETDDDELDWVRGIFPATWRDATLEDEALLADRKRLPARHIKMRKVKPDEEASLPAALVHTEMRRGKDPKKTFPQIPAIHDGLKAGDVYAMSMGGSGDRLAFALSRAGETRGANLYRISTKNLKELRGEQASKDNDPEMLIEALAAAPELFYHVDTKDRALIWVRECYRARTDAMKARIGAEQRLRQQLIGQVFCDPNGEFSELAIEAAFDELKANDRVFQNLVDEEAIRNKALTKAVEAMPEWQHVFEGITGLGPMIAARLLNAIGNIRRFTAAPNPDEIARLRATAREYEAEVDLNKYVVELDDRLNECEFRRNVMYFAAQAQRANGHVAYAMQIKEAIALYERVVKLRKEAYAAGQEPDAERVKELHIEARSALKNGHYTAALKLLSPAVRDRDNHYQVVQIVRSHLDKLGLKEEAAYLDEALANYKAIHDLRRDAFHKSQSRFVAYCGVHVMKGGKHGDRPTEKQFPRRRSGDVASYSPDARQGLYLFVSDQCNKRPDSEWGKRLRENKVKLRLIHPEVVKVEGKQRYTDGHIHKMAVWRTATQFAQWLFGALMKLDNGSPVRDVDTSEPATPIPAQSFSPETQAEAK